MLNKISQSVEQILVALAEEQYKKEVKYAFDIFKRPFNHFDMGIDIEHGFNQWLIHDYVTRDNSKLAIKVLDEKEMIDIISNSIYSVFRVHHEKKNVVLKDLFTAKDYTLDSEQVFEDGDIVSVRLYPVKSKYVIVENAEFYEQTMHATIRKSVMSKYNEYCSSNQPVAIEMFIKESSQLIYHLTNIIHHYESQLETDDMEVHIAEYGIKEREILLDALLKTSYFQIIETYGDEMTIILLDDFVQIAEVLVTSHKLEIEALTKVHMTLAREILEKYAESRAVFIQERELTVDELLND